MLHKNMQEWETLKYHLLRVREKLQKYCSEKYYASLKNIHEAINEIEKNLQIWAMNRLQIKEKLKVNSRADTPRFGQYNVPRDLYV